VLPPASTKPLLTRLYPLQAPFGTPIGAPEGSYFFQALYRAFNSLPGSLPFQAKLPGRGGPSAHPQTFQVFGFVRVIRLRPPSPRSSRASAMAGAKPSRLA